MQILNLCLLVAQVLILLCVFRNILASQKRPDLPSQKTNSIRLRFIVIFLAIGAILGVVQAILRFMNLYFS